MKRQGISWERWSSTVQEKGDSPQRQASAFAAFCEKFGLEPSPQAFSAKGRSAYHGDHLEELERFSEAVKHGIVPKGSVLVIEHSDRLDRRKPRQTLRLWEAIIESGVDIGVCEKGRIYTEKDLDDFTLFELLIEWKVNHEKSERLAGMIKSKWVRRRKDARKSGTPMTRRLPAWVQEEDGTLVLHKARAAVVKEIYRLAATGYGQSLIVRTLNDRQIPAFVVTNGGGQAPARRAFCGEWRRGYVSLILSDRRAVGEFQPRLRDGNKDGAPIKGYYPAAVSEAEWLAARAGAEQRRQKPGRVSGHVNLFQGLLKNARAGGTASYFSVPRNDRGKQQRVLINSDHTDKRKTCYSFPEATFETAVLTCLRELDARKVLSGQQGPDETITLAGRLAVVEAKVREVEAELRHGDLAALAKLLRELEADKAHLQGQLREAGQRAAFPLSESWGEAKGLMDVLASAADPTDVRLRLRAALRRIIESVWLLVVPRGRNRLAAVQVWFASGKQHRDYLIVHIPPKANARSRTPGGWWVRSLSEIAEPGQLDLRKPDHARRLEKVLAVLELE